MAKGIVYLTAAIDVASRRALAWKIANTLEACHAVDVLEEAFTRYSTPEIVNIDQGSQFTATMFVDAVKVRGCQISMDGRGAWRDNVFIERLWRTLKYEEVYLHAYDSIAQARHGIDRGLNWYNTGRSGRTRPLLYQAADHAEAHRSSTAAGAKLFIVD